MDHLDQLADWFLKHAAWEDSLEIFEYFFICATQDLIHESYNPLLDRMLASVIVLPPYPGRPNQSSDALVDYAIRLQQFELAARLRTRGAGISKRLPEQITKLLNGHPDRYNYPAVWQHVPRDVWRCIRNPPHSECPPAPLRLYAWHGKVITTWPPPDHPEWPEGRKVTKVVRAYWRKIAKLRRQEAVRNAPHFWSLARKWAKMRGIAMFWLGRTQQRVCAADGSGRAADLLEYRHEF